MRQSGTYCLDVAVVGEARPSEVPDARPARLPTAERITAGALVCIARWGTAKTTLDDIAREAGCSRATIYRLFPGGKRAVLDAAGEVELARILDELVGVAGPHRVARRACWWWPSPNRCAPSADTRPCST